MALTQKQETFCLGILRGLTASDAYRQAYEAGGMKPETIHRQAKSLMDNPKIAARIEELRAPAIEQAQITVAYVLDMLKTNLERAMQHEEVRDSEGRPTGEYRYEGSVANKALELLGKHLGMFTDKHEHTGKGGAPLALPVIQIMRDSADPDPAD